MMKLRSIEEIVDSPEDIKKILKTIVDTKLKDNSSGPWKIIKENNLLEGIEKIIPYVYHSIKGGKDMKKLNFSVSMSILVGVKIFEYESENGKDWISKFSSGGDLIDYIISKNPELNKEIRNLDINLPRILYLILDEEDEKIDLKLDYLDLSSLLVGIFSFKKKILKDNIVKTLELFETQKIDWLIKKLVIFYEKWWREENETTDDYNDSLLFAWEILYGISSYIRYTKLENSKINVREVNEDTRKLFSLVKNLFGNGIKWWIEKNLPGNPKIDFKDLKELIDKKYPT